MFLMNRRSQKELPDFLPMTELRSSCQPFLYYGKKMGLINRSKHPISRTAALDGCETQGTHSARHEDEDSSLWVHGGTEARCQLYNFPTANQKRNSSKCD